MSPNGIEARLLARSVVSDTGCRVWQGRPNSYGYGRMWVNGQRPFYVHRLAYEVWVGPIVEQSIDHLCGNRLCIEPTHLEQVSLAENTRRGNDRHRLPTCPSGHDYDEENNYRDPSGWRRCRVCRRDGMRRVARKVAQ